MSEGKRGSRRSQKPTNATGGQEEQNQPTQEQPSFSEFPIRFRDAYLYSLQIDRHPENETKLITQAGGSLAPSAEINVTVLQPRIDQHLMQVGVAVSALVPGQDAPVWSIEAVMNGVFEITEGTDPALVQTFAQSTALSLIWPYIRELFQDLSIRMRVPVLMLNTLDLRQPGASSSTQE